MKRSLAYRLTAYAVVLILTVATMDAYAEQSLRNPKELRHEAFLRGGTAISEAWNSVKLAVPVVATSIVPPAPPVPQAAAAEEKHHRVMLWIGLGITAGIAAYLIQKSVTNHRKIFGSTM